MIEGRIYNFSAGPSILPEPVLLQAQKEFLNYGGSGMSVLEMSHRSKVYDGIIKGAEANLRSVMGIPDNYKVLFLQGGASGMFAAIPMNLAVKNGTADYIVSGNFSGQALKEAGKYLHDKARCAGTSKDDNFNHIPTQDELSLNPDADYVHASFGHVRDSLFRIGEVAQELGIRTCLCYEVSDRDGMKKSKDAVDENAACRPMKRNCSWRLTTAWSSGSFWLRSVWRTAL